MPRASEVLDDSGDLDRITADHVQNTAIDPESTDFRDAVDLGNLSALGELGMEEEEERRAAESDAATVLATMRALDQGDAVKWRISRVGSEDPAMDGYLATWSAKLMTLDRIRDHFGGGIFHCKGFRGNKYAGHKTLEIAGDAPRRKKLDAGGNVNGSGPGFDVASFLAQQEARDASRRREEQQLRRDAEEREEKRRQDRNTLLLAALTPAATVLAAMFGNKGTDIAALMTAMRPAPQPTLLETMTALKQLSPSPAPVSDPIDKAGKVIAMLQDLGGGKSNGSETGWLDIVKELVKGPAASALVEGLAMRAQAAQANSNPSPPPNGLPAGGVVVRRPAALPAPVPTATPSAATTAGSAAAGAGPLNEEQMMLALLPHLPWLQEQLTRLGIAAAKEKDPELYAALFLEELPDGVQPQLILQLLSRSDWFVKLQDIDARIAPYGEWFEALHVHLVAFIQESLAEGGIEESAPVPPQTAVEAAAKAARPAPAAEIQRPQGVPSLFGENG